MFRHPARSAAFAPAGACLALVFALSGCAVPGVVADPSPTSSAEPSSSASASAPPAPAQPTLVPDGTAAENLPLFRAVVAEVWSTPENLAGRAYIDALVAVGFDKTAMQITPDQTTVGNPAESIQFSVLWGGQCLVGQVGPATGAPVTVVVPALGEGACLIGQTRPIDW